MMIRQELKSISIKKNAVAKRNITGYAFKLAKSMMPKISETERAALNGNLQQSNTFK